MGPVPQFELPNRRETQTYGRNSSKGQKDEKDDSETGEFNIQGGELNIQEEAEKVGTAQTAEENTMGGSQPCVKTPNGSCKQGGI